jgi:cytochrome P450
MWLWLAVVVAMAYVVTAAVRDLAAYMRCKYYESQGFVMKFVPGLGFMSLFTSRLSREDDEDVLCCLRRSLDACKHSPGLVMNDWQQMKAYIWLTDPRLIADFFLKEETCMKRVCRFKDRLWMAPFYSNDAASTAHSDLFADLLHKDRLAGIVRLTSAACRAKMSGLFNDNGLIQGKKPVDFKAIVLDIVTDVSGKIIFGQDLTVPFIDGSGVDVVEAIDEVLSSLQSNKGNYSSTNFFLFGLLSKFDLSRVFRKANQKSKLIKEAVIKRFKDRMAVEEAKLGDCLIDSIVKQVKNCGLILTDDHVVAFVTEFVAAGVYSVSRAATSMLYHLAGQPGLTAEIRAESRSLGLLSKSVDYDGLCKAAVLASVFKETLRLHSPVPFLHDRVATCDFTLGNITIKKGEILCIPLTHANASKAMKRGLDKFDIKNVTDSQDNTEPCPRFNPFSEGRRSCPGIYLAGIMVKTMVLEVISHVNIEIGKDHDVSRWILDHGYGLDSCILQCSLLKTV